MGGSLRAGFGSLTIHGSTKEGVGGLGTFSIWLFFRICSMRNARRKRNPSFRLGNASLFCPLSPSLSIKMIKKEGELASYSRVRSLPSLPRSLSPMLKKGLEPCREWGGAKDLPLNSASRGSTLPPWISKAPLAWAKMGIGNKDGSPLNSARDWTGVSSVNV